jgi:N-6 DNA Methylase
LLVEMLEPLKGRVFDPACGSCGLFVQSGRFVEAHGGRPAEISVYGQERNQATWRIGRMNLAIHGLSGEVKYTEGGSLQPVVCQMMMMRMVASKSEWSCPSATWPRDQPSTPPGSHSRPLLASRADRR